MDVTPNDKMFQAMQSFTDALVGEEPTSVEKSGAADRRRSQRRRVMDFLHTFCALSMREGAARAMNPHRGAAINPERSPMILNG